MMVMAKTRPILANAVPLASDRQCLGHLKETQTGNYPDRAVEFCGFCHLGPVLRVVGGRQAGGRMFVLRSLRFLRGVSVGASGDAERRRVDSERRRRTRTAHGGACRPFARTPFLRQDQDQAHDLGFSHRCAFPPEPLLMWPGHFCLSCLVWLWALSPCSCYLSHRPAAVGVGVACSPHFCRMWGWLCHIRLCGTWLRHIRLRRWCCLTMPHPGVA